jgi:YD repeat-containing protein
MTKPAGVRSTRTRHTDEESNSTDYTYFTTGSSSDLLQKAEVAPAGLALDTQYTYDSAGNVATETDPRGKATSYTWDNLRRLTQRQAPSPLSYRVQDHYDGNGNLTSTDVENIDKDGNVVSGNQWITTTGTYTNTDDLATLTEEIDASTTRTTTLEYDNNQNRVRVVKPLANKEKWTYDERDLVLSHVRGEGATGESTEEYVHDDNGNRTVVEDGRDNDTTSTFDLFDRRTKETDALGHYTDFELDKNGQVTKVTRKNSSNAELQRETYFFDERGRHWKTSALFKDSSQTYSDAVTTIERMKTGQEKVVTDPRGKTTTREYDAAVRHKKTTDAMGNEISYTLDDNGNRTAWTIKERDGAANVFHDYEATYDELDRRKTYVEVDRNNASTSRTWSPSSTARTSGSRTSSGATRWTASRCLSRRTCSTTTRTGTPPR